MAYVNQDNFDWDQTKVDVLLFIPNFKRRHLLVPTLQKIQTSLSKDRWLILAVNDGVHEDLSDLEKHNLKYFTFERDSAKERNGCQIRNYVLKRLQSKILATRDPEIFIEGGDYFLSVSSIDEKTVYRPNSMTELAEPESPKIINNPAINLNDLMVRSKHIVTPQNHRAFHAGVAVHTKTMVDIRGYDERFKNGYGWEDVDVMNRLMRFGCKTFIDKNVDTFHVWHPRRTRFLKTVMDNQEIYELSRKQNTIVANTDCDWGEGL